MNFQNHVNLDMLEKVEDEWKATEDIEEEMEQEMEEQKIGEETEEEMG